MLFPWAWGKDHIIYMYIYICYLHKFGGNNTFDMVLEHVKQNCYIQCAICIGLAKGLNSICHSQKFNGRVTFYMLFALVWRKAQILYAIFISLVEDYILHASCIG